MIVKSVESGGFRNLKFSKVNLSEDFNLVVGPNASGKTSFLEVIHIALTGKSFRTPNFKKYIHHDKDECWVALNLLEYKNTALMLELADLKHDSICRLAVKRDRFGEANIKIDSQGYDSFAKTVGLLPIAVLAPDLAALVDASSKERRQYLDWSVFHVKHLFRSDWVKYQHALKQKNVLLKHDKFNLRQGEYWDILLGELGNSITQQRMTVFEELNKIILELVASNAELAGLSFTFYPGWNSEKSDLLGTLKKNQTKDRQIGYTSQGPHRADIKSQLNGKEAKDVLSRGQRKWLTYCMKLAQVKLAHLVYGKKTLVLIDDFNSELDLKHQTMVLDLLASMRSQVILTAIEDSSFKQQSMINKEYKLFHVKQGDFLTYDEE